MDQSSRDDHQLSRRHLLQWMGGLSALLATPGCVRQPREYLIPYARMPEHMIPGEPQFYATAMPSDGYGIGLLAKTHLGRPIKIEGNPQHPASLGATDAFAQASILSLYDPERARAVTGPKAVGTWSDFRRALRQMLENPARITDGKIRIVLPRETSPTVLETVKQLQQTWPGIIWHRMGALPLGAEGRVASGLLRRPVDAVYDLTRADRVLSFDYDIFSMGPGRLRYARELTQRRGEDRQQDMNRLYSVHTTPTLFSAYADHTLPVSVPGLRASLLALARALGVEGGGSPILPAEQQRWITELADDLKSHRGRSLVLLDPLQADDLQQLILQINATLGNMGQTLVWQDSVLDRNDILWASEEALAQDLEQHKVEVLLLLGVNPAYHSAFAPTFREQLPRLAFSAHLSHYYDETSRLCHWHIPQDHYLESWGDIAAFDGTTSILQPTIAPLFASKSILGFLQGLSSASEQSDYDLVRGFWEQQRGGPRFAQDWESWLHAGLIPQTERARIAWTEPQWPPITQRANVAPATSTESMDVVLRPDPSLGDGSMANNPWLQELPKPFSKLTWDHALLMHPDRARHLNVQTEDQVELEIEGRKLVVPVLILDAHPRETCTLTLGYGRDMPGHLCHGIGVNAYQLRRPQDGWSLEGVHVRKLKTKRYPLARTQTHFMEYPHQNLVRIGDWQEFLQNPELFTKKHEEPRTMEPTIPIQPSRILNQPEDPLQWGMTIDTSTCIGCNACVVACQAENNIPVVGKHEVIAGREMHWLRIDHYFEEKSPDADCTFQPVPCMHCETAPCELVCPVEATAHSEQGLNQMVYNRCVGTRYCSNNCPYKVRHFNFHNYGNVNSLTQLQRNPDVTVRSRGVMEKCTYCVQRINAIRITATREGREVSGNEVQTACAQACPTRAIIFGNIKEKTSTVAQWKRSTRNYDLLGELNTRPRTSYLAHLKNLNAILRKLSGRSQPEPKEG
ncbi:MAG TPA: 4Fe-4S dicluster domain-containing protein [Oligoflexus sp.]|uniref:4Fe-4S dicluster domain-containing protein n=1 Tax=Oligoflexus sp. TaxID=1971216 RepID=UPI002D80A1D2|nr:4Fe-4S dicluster domain-containing protein [Oligoflexus sp.]HET9241290.1 4Fe-4S dicluster domain-containing protein [Oligoflexus sp.]